MKYIRLLLTNVLRNRRRSLLTVSCIAVSLFLVATLHTLLTELESSSVAPDAALRLVTRHRVSLANILPISYRDRIARVPGVDAVIGAMWFGGVYKDPKNFFAQFAVDTDKFFTIYGDMDIPEDQKQGFLKDRTGALVGEHLAERFGWRVGDRIHLQGALFPMNAELNIRGIYAGGFDDGGSLYFHWEYFNEGLNKPNFTGFFEVRAHSPEQVAGVEEQIDDLFRNSTAPTKTESEKAFVLGFLSMMGNVRLLITSISSAVIFTIILVAANTMAMSIRERVREIGTLKALGFRKRQILFLLLGESVLLSASGAIMGALGAKVFFRRINIAAITGGFVQRFAVSGGTLLLSAAIGVAVGVIAAGIPAWRAARRSVVDALRDTA